MVGANAMCRNETEWWLSNLDLQTLYDTMKWRLVGHETIKPKPWIFILFNFHFAFLALLWHYRFGFDFGGMSVQSVSVVICGGRETWTWQHFAVEIRSHMLMAKSSAFFIVFLLLSRYLVNCLCWWVRYVLKIYLAISNSNHLSKFVFNSCDFWFNLNVE